MLVVCGYFETAFEWLRALAKRLSKKKRSFDLELKSIHLRAWQWVIVREAHVYFVSLVAGQWPQSLMRLLVVLVFAKYTRPSSISHENAVRKKGLRKRFGANPICERHDLGVLAATKRRLDTERVNVNIVLVTLKLASHNSNTDGDFL